MTRFLLFQFSHLFYALTVSKPQLQRSESLDENVTSSNWQKTPIFEASQTPSVLFLCKLGLFLNVYQNIIQVYYDEAIYYCEAIYYDRVIHIEKGIHCNGAIYFDRDIEVLNQKLVDIVLEASRKSYEVFYLVKVWSCSNRLLF